MDSVGSQDETPDAMQVEGGPSETPSGVAGETHSETPAGMAVETSGGVSSENTGGVSSENTGGVSSETPSETPSGVTGETPSETPVEKPAEDGEQPSIVSFFGRSAGVAPSSGFKLNLTIDLGTVEPKRQKISSEWSVCWKD